MATTVANSLAAAPLAKLENLRLSPAKANLLNHENRPRVGSALHRAVAIVGLSLKEAAALVNVDAAQFGRWIAGTENLQLHRIYGTKLHGPFAIEMARDHDDCVVETTVTYTARRTA